MADKPNEGPKDALLYAKLVELLDKESRQSESGTPDYILANYLLDCLRAYEKAALARDIWIARMLNNDSATETTKEVEHGSG